MIEQDKEIKAFTCPNCGHSLPSKELFSFGKNHIVICSYCSANLEPVSAKSFHWGFSLGFLGFLIPAQLLKFFINSSMLSFIGGVIGSIITILLVALYVKKKTFFKLKLP